MYQADFLIGLDRELIQADELTLHDMVKKHIDKACPNVDLLGPVEHNSYRLVSPAIDWAASNTRFTCELRLHQQASVNVGNMSGSLA